MATLYAYSPNGTQATLSYSVIGFTQSLAQNGWCKLPNGLILQWGYCKGFINNKIPFPITFNSVYYVISTMCSIGFASGDGYGRHSQYVTTKDFQTVDAPSTAYPIAWISMGN